MDSGKIKKDSPHDFHDFWRPQPHWPDDLIRGHKDDILCVVQCPPSLLATSSYDGEIIIWNLISGHIYCKLNTPVLTYCSEDPEDRSISHLTFLKTRAAKFESTAASLISNGPQGSVIFWSLFSGAQLIASFIPSRGKSQIRSIVVTTGDTCVYVADNMGYVYMYDIKDYALRGPEQEPPKSVKFWRAHINAVTSLELIEEEKALLSSSIDCTVRLWSMDGEYIGTFGQSELWDVYTAASWKHPVMPYEILKDPKSMPVHQVLTKNVSTSQIDHLEEGKIIQEKSSAKAEQTLNLNSLEDPPTDVEIKKEINIQAHQQTRLPQEQNKNSNRSFNTGWPSAYHTLKCHEVANIPPIGGKPDLSIIGTDFFFSDIKEKNN